MKLTKDVMKKFESIIIQIVTTNDTDLFNTIKDTVFNDDNTQYLVCNMILKCGKENQINNDVISLTEKHMKNNNIKNYLK